MRLFVLPSRLEKRVVLPSGVRADLPFRLLVAVGFVRFGLAKQGVGCLDECLLLRFRRRQNVLRFRHQLLTLNSLVVLSYVLEFHFPQAMKFYFDREANLPTYFSSLLLLFVAATAGIIAAFKWQARDAFARHWVGLAFIFLGLSVDEAASFHEVLIEPLRQAYHLSGLLRFSWVLVGGVFVLVFSFAYLKFFLVLARPMQRLFALSALVYVSGVLGMEMVGGYLFVDIDDFSSDSLPYMIVMTVEETLEMSGVLLFFYTLLRYLRGYVPQLTIAIH